MTTIETCHVALKFAQAFSRTRGSHALSFRGDSVCVAIRAADHRGACSARGMEAGMPSAALTFSESLRDNASLRISSLENAERIDRASEDVNRFENGAHGLLGKRTPGSERSSTNP